MKGAVNYNGGMIIVDKQGDKHIFCETETEFITTLIYKYRQARPHRKGVIHSM